MGRMVETAHPRLSFNISSGPAKGIGSPWRVSISMPPAASSKSTLYASVMRSTRDVVAYANDDPMRDILVPQLVDTAVRQDAKGLFHHSLVCHVAGDEEIGSSVARIEPSRLMAKPPITT